ncbi:MAG TPA: hypothetical protein VFU47_06055 [Armatimonadota bacterium]|nr:hypothetical protein [Armatimonadota bacterium]
MERLAEARGVRCLRLSIRDLEVPTPEAMEGILDRIDAALSEGAVYLHCWGGVGRTGTVVARWHVRHGLADGSNVLQVLARLRSMGRQRSDRQSPETEVQLRLVDEWAGRQTVAEGRGPE